MTRVQRDQQQGKAAKFITYSCSASDPDQTVVEENFDEAASVASSRESRVWKTKFKNRIRSKAFLLMFLVPKNKVINWNSDYYLLLPTLKFDDDIK